MLISSKNKTDRLNRGGFAVILIIISIIFCIAIEASNEFIKGTMGLISVVFLITAIIGRLHDTNRSGYYALILFVPYVNFLAFLLLLFLPGTKGANNYGLPYPYVGSDSAVPLNQEEVDSSKQCIINPVVLPKNERLKQALKANHPYRDMQIFNKI